MSEKINVGNKEISFAFLGSTQIFPNEGFQFPTPTPTPTPTPLPPCVNWKLTNAVTLTKSSAYAYHWYDCNNVYQTNYVFTAGTDVPPGGATVYVCGFSADNGGNVWTVTNNGLCPTPTPTPTPAPCRTYQLSGGIPFEYEIGWYDCSNVYHTMFVLPAGGTICAQQGSITLLYGSGYWTDIGPC